MGGFIESWDPRGWVDLVGAIQTAYQALRTQDINLTVFMDIDNGFIVLADLLIITGSKIMIVTVFVSTG